MFMAPLISWAAPDSPGSGIQGTSHDFLAEDAAVVGGDTAAMTTEPIGLCTFCHTPHKAISTELLWNHTLSTNSFSWDVPATTAGTQFPTFTGDTYKGATAKCLSCHDGSVAIGDIAWFMEGKPATPLNPMQHGATEAVNVGFGGNMAGNHPVAMPYPYLNVPNNYNGTTNGAMLATADWQADPTANNIRLFNDDGTGNITAGPVAGKTGIECSSCHDPHNRASVDDLFLRGKLVGSTQASGYICLQCHVK